MSLKDLFKRNKLTPVETTETPELINVSDRATYYQYDNDNCKKSIILIDEEIGVPLDRIDLSIYGFSKMARQPIKGLEDLIHYTNYFLKNSYNVHVLVSNNNEFCIKFMESVLK